ncbi:DUF3616 domain-containing protein [Dokdonella ginsengisoli]|uniref:DUF3616 domain-containing protein n=1 Tax=Dokdonella ginsengisoli TaxID=363846 RepID=A0ABV9QRK8_9GAMM
MLVASTVQAQVRITEWMYDGAGGEYVELTNVGGQPVDLTGWSYDDDSATPGVFDLGGLGVVQPGESVVFTESDAETFRADWGLCAGQKLLGGYTNNLGRNDQINIFDASHALVDRLTYGDQNIPGSIRTQGASGWVSAAGLGANNALEWTKSSVGDTEGSFASSGGAIGSPGRSARAGVAHDPCGSVGAALVEKPLAAGDDHACGIRNGVAYCWGIETRGQLGNGAGLTGNQQSPTPVDVSGLPAGIEWAAVDAADLHTCGLTTEGALYCWGAGNSGALGAGPGVTGDQVSPVAVDISALPPGATFVDVAVGEGHTCAVAADGTGYCWGSGGPGQLGIGGNGATVWVPTAIDMSAMPAGTKWKRLSAGSIHTCGVTTGGDAYCWGNTTYGRIGSDQFDTNVYSPVAVDLTGLPAGTQWDWVVAGDNHSCGLTTQGVVYCWGRDNVGQLGNGGMASGNYNPRPLPLDLTGLPGGTTWSFVEAGDELTCAVTLGGATYCWGNIPGSSTNISPVAVSLSALPPGSRFDHIAVATSGTHMCAQSTADVGYCWGTDPFGQLGNGPDLGDEWVPNTPIAYPGGVTPTIEPATIAAGLEFACGLDPAGAAYCWGRDSVGQLGNGATVTANMVSPYPVDMSALPAGTRFASITAGGTSACALTPEGAAYCWGEDNYGQLGNGAGVTGNQYVPVAVDMAPLNGARFVSLSAARTHVCGVADSGTGYCWGRGGALGLPAGIVDDQPSPSPVDMALLPAGVTLSSISAAFNHTCAVASNGALYCWGQNGNGVIGVGVSGGSYPITAVDVSALPAGTVFDQVTTGDSHSCALSTGHVAYCWGAGINGATGNGAQSLDILRPNPVVTSTIPAGTHFVRLEGGGTNTCGILDTGAAYCWGFGNWGALGTGDGTSRYSPHPVSTANLPAGTVFTELSADNNLTCAATQAGKFYCWGRDNYGQLGNGPTLTADPSHEPTAVDPFETVIGLPPTIVVAQSIVTGSVGDPTNPGTTLTLGDPDSDLAALAVEVSSSNAAVIPASGVVVAGTGAERTVSFSPTGRGVSNVTFIVTDPEGNGQSVTMQYASSNQAPDPSGRYHHWISDASAALGVGDGYVILLNDETNTIFLHREDRSGPPVKTWSFSSGDLGTGSEVDFEGIARFGDLVLLTGSHGNNRSGSARPERRTFVAATISGSGADTELTFRGRYNNLWSELRSWDQNNGHGLGADALGFIAATTPGVLPNAPDGFNIEGLEFSPDGEAVYLGFRAPTINVAGVHRALVVPLLNVESIINGTPGTGPAQFGAPILMDLGGRSIRAMASNAEGDYLISAGPSPQNGTWALYTWDGNPDHAPALNQELPAENALTGGTWEAIGTVPHPLTEGALVRLITDSGDSNFYGTGATKDLQQPFQKSYSQVFALAAVPGGGQSGIRITEWMYGGPGGEFVELTNVGAEAVDLTGWSYDDDSATPGVFSLSGFGIVQPGQSVVFTESDAEAFRAEWGLCAEVKILGGYTNNLGGNDQINIFDAGNQLVDRLAYGSGNFPGSIVTSGASGWVSAAGLGADDVYQWTLSTVGDVEESRASAGGAIGNPGSSKRASVPFEQCPGVVEHSLAVVIEGSGQGTVTGDGIACPGDCEQSYPQDTAATLTATPSAGFVFGGWGGDCSGVAECSISMGADKNVTATFLAEAALSFDPATLGFGEVEVGTTSQALSATLINGGGTEATGLSFVAPGNGFTIDAGACGDRLPPAGRCDVVVMFAPTAAGPVQATLNVGSTSGGTASVALTGTGVESPDPATNLAVDIQARQQHVQRGQLLDHLVVVNNLGPDAATSSSVSSVLSAALDVDFAQWLCVGPASSGCTASGQGDISDSGLTIPAGGSVSYLISAPVRWDAEGALESQAQAHDAHDTEPSNNTAGATAYVVLFRSGFEAYGNGVNATPPQSATAAETITMTWPAADGNLIGTVLTGEAGSGSAAREAFRLERFDADSRSWARLVASDEGGNEYASAWLPVRVGEEIALTFADAQSSSNGEHVESGIQRTAQLQSRSAQLHLPLVLRPATYRLMSAAPLSVIPAAAED